ncbi:hypothetical protein ON010_g2970 [Phytophthora cinnamomi]|nr:hypothetical protein ON010_g2970 [Phytophthora cinnamomi]
MPNPTSVVSPAADPQPDLYSVRAVQQREPDPASDRYRSLDVSVSGAVSPPIAPPNLLVKVDRVDQHSSSRLLPSPVAPTWFSPGALFHIVISCVFAIDLGIPHIGSDYKSYEGVNADLVIVYVGAVNIKFISFNGVLPNTSQEWTSFYRERAGARVPLHNRPPKASTRSLRVATALSHIHHHRDDFNQGVSSH